MKRHGFEIREGPTTRRAEVQEQTKKVASPHKLSLYGFSPLHIIFPNHDKHSTMIEMSSSIRGDPFGHPTPPCDDDRQPSQGVASIMEGARYGADSNHLSDIDDPTGHPRPLGLRDRRVDKFSPHMQKKLCRWGIFAIVMVVVGIVALLVSNHATNKQKVDPLLAYKERFINFRTILGNYSQPWTFALPNSPQTKSLQWLVFQDQTLSTNPDVKRLVQRHALMTLFYGCDGENWAGTLAVSPSWIQEVGTHECEFAGVTCDEAGTIVHFEAGQGQLSGQLPDEISLLSHLISLKIYVSDLQGTLPVSLFTRLSNLGESFCAHVKFSLSS